MSLFTRFLKPTTPCPEPDAFEAAAMEWDRRIGDAASAIRSWRVATAVGGRLCPLHATSAEDALYRLEDLVGLASTTVPRRSIAAAIQMIVFVAKTTAGRRVEQIVHCTGHRDGHHVLEDTP